MQLVLVFFFAFLGQYYVKASLYLYESTFFVSLFCVILVVMYTKRKEPDNFNNLKSIQLLNSVSYDLLSI